MYAIVDIETTGGHADKNGITEIAIFLHDGKSVTEQFSSLINPEMEIPQFIENYTGITNKMVANAPTFSQLSAKINELLSTHIFVAHNVNFDYTFVKHFLQKAGYNWQTKKLCTVRLSRKAFPGYKSYSLGNLCATLGITLNNRHRAFGDAAATVSVFERILHHDTDGSLINGFLKKGSHEASLPPNLPQAEFNTLPNKPGVYYFYNQQGKIIYVGKAVNLKKRVLSHFTGNATNEKKQHFLRDIYHLSFELTATELQALILESVEIKRHWPIYNKAQKRIDFSYGIYDYEDQKGYLRLAIDRTRKHVKPLQSFPKLADAFNHLQRLVIDYNLCPKLCMINSYKEPCRALEAGCCQGACMLQETASEYNIRAQAAINELCLQQSYAIVDVGLNYEQQSCILVVNGKFYGMGYMPNYVNINNIDVIKQYITPLKENFSITELVKPEKLSNNLIIGL